MTERLGVCGNPVGHSLSPAIHNRLYETYGFDWDYGLYPAEDATDLARLFDDMRAGGSDAPTLGLNITTPYKVVATKMVDMLDESAKTCGALNTVVAQRSAEGVCTLVGYNTDGAGMLSLLLHAGIRLERDRVVVCGTGALAAATAAELVAQGGKPTVLGRSRERVQGMMRRSGLSGLPFRIYEESARTIQTADCIIDATSAGMEPDGMPPIGIEGLRPGQLVVEAAYATRTPLLLSVARERGCQVLDGVDLLVEQGLYAHLLWVREAQRQGLRSSQRFFDHTCLPIARRLMLSTVS